MTQVCPPTPQREDGGSCCCSQTDRGGGGAVEESFHSPERRSELVVADRTGAGLDEHALHRPPPVVLVGRSHAVNLSLAADGVAVLLARHAQVHVSAHVLEAHGLLALPVVAVTLDGPHVQVVSFSVLSKGADLLRTAAGRQRHLLSTAAHLCLTWLLDSGEVKWCVWRFRPVFMCVMRMA